MIRALQSGKAGTLAEASAFAGVKRPHERKVITMKKWPKKTLSFIVAAAAALSSAVTVPPAAALSSAVTVPPETGIGLSVPASAASTSADDWRTWDNVEADKKTSTVTVDTSTVHGDSKYSVKITSTEYNRVFVEKKVKVKPGVKYYMSAYIKVVGFSYNTVNSKYEGNGRGAFLASPWCKPQMTPVTENSWTKYVWEYIAKDDETEHTVALNFGNSVTYCKGTAYFSDFTFGEYDNTKWHKGYSSAGSVFSVDKNVTYNNAPYSFKIDNKEFSYSYIEKEYKVKPATEYKISAYVKYENFKSDDTSVSRGARICRVGGARDTFSNWVTCSEWSPVILTFRTSDDEKSIRIRLQTDMKTKGTAYFSNIKIEEVTETTNEWNVLVVCFRKANVTVDGKNYNLSFADSTIKEHKRIFSCLKDDVKTVFGDLMSVKSVDYKIAETPIRDFVYYSGNDRHINFSSKEIVDELNGFLKEKHYQHVICITPLFGKVGYWGLSGIDYDFGVKSIQITDYPDKTDIDRYKKGIWLTTWLSIHESMHTLETDTAWLTNNKKMFGLLDTMKSGDPYGLKPIYGGEGTEFYQAEAHAKLPDGLGIDPRAYYRSTGKYVLVSDDMTPDVSIESSGTLPTHIGNVITVSKPADAYYTGKAIKPKVTVSGASVSDYTISYADNVRPGTAKVIIKGKGKYTGSVEKTFKIKLKKTTAKIKNNALTWAKVSGANGYEIYYSKDGSKFKLLKDVTGTSYDLSKLKKGSYKFKVRAYSKSNGVKVYADWSKKVSVTKK